MPPQLRRAFERFAARGGGPDLTSLELTYEAAGDWDAAGRVVRELRREPADTVLAAALSPAFRCSLHPRALSDGSGPAPATIWPPQLPDVIEAAVEVRGAYFHPALEPAHFGLEAPLRPFHMPAVRLAVAVGLAVLGPVVEAWTDPRGALDLERLERWGRDEIDLVGLLDWVLLEPYRSALPAAFAYYLGGSAWSAASRVGAGGREPA